MNLLGVQQNSASRPSLFSSIWSIQVQHQNEVSDFRSGHSYVGLNMDQTQTPGVRNAISLAELSSVLLEKADTTSTIAPSSFQRSTTCPILTTSTFESCLPKCSKDKGRNGGGLAAVTAQQKNRNICEWLQKVSSTDPLSESSSITSVNDTAKISAALPT